MYSFADYLNAAGLSPPAFAHRVQMRFPPFNHQVGDLQFLASNTRAGLWSEPGVGKTLPVQAYAAWLVGMGNKVVVTMPPVLVQQFRQSFSKTYIGIDEHVKADVLQGTPKQREKLIASWDGCWPDLLVMSYRMFVDYHKQLLTEGYSCVIVDEATAVKSPSSQLHHAVKVFGGNHKRDSNGIVLMTGTPVETNVTDAYGLIAILNPDRYGSKKMFERVHCIKRDMPIAYNEDGEITGTREQIIGYKNLPLLNESLFLMGRRILKADVSDLPPRMISEIPITLSRGHRELYKKIVDERIAEIGDRVLDLTESTALYQGLQRLILNPEDFTDDKIDNEVLNTLDTLLHESLAGHKVVVYCWFQSTIERMKARYAKLNPAVLYGKTSGNKRDAEKMKFINDPTCRVIFANPRSGGVGVDGFQAVSSHAIFAEVCPFVGVFQQSIDRLHRTGQKSSAVTVYVLVPTGTIAVKLRNDLLRKDMQQELTVQDKRTILHNLLGEEGIQGSLDDVSFDNIEDVVDDSQLED